MTQDELKQAVARAALAYVVDDAWIGVGSGSTANFFIDELAKIKRSDQGALSSSVKTAERLKSHGIPVEELNNVDDVPVYIDGADEVTAHGAMIKGGGGALTREKIVAAVARKFVCIVDRVEAGRRARQVPAAGRGDPDGAQLRRARSSSSSAGSPALRARTSPPTTATSSSTCMRLSIVDPVGARSRRSTRSPASSPLDCSRGAAPTSSCSAPSTASKRSRATPECRDDQPERPRPRHIRRCRARTCDGVGEAARNAAAPRPLARDTAAKTRRSNVMASAIRRDEARLLAANAEMSPRHAAAEHDAAFVDRLTLTPKTIAAMADGLDAKSRRCPIPSAKSPISSIGRPASRSA